MGIDLLLFLLLFLQLIQKLWVGFGKVLLF